MNRRNVLMGLGTIVVGGGAALGSGAFSTVEANRSVSVHVADDADALIGLEATGNSEYVTNEGGPQDNLLEIDLSSGALGSEAGGLNVGTTSIDDAFTVYNNHTSPVNVTIEGVNADGGNIQVQFQDSNGDAFGTTEIADSEVVSIEIVVAEATDTSESIDQDVTIEAEPDS